MNFEEQAAKPLLASAGIAVPAGALAASPAEAADYAGRLGPVVVKAQVPAGKRGKAGGIKPADSPEEAAQAAETILGMTIGGHRVEKVLIVGIAAGHVIERYAGIGVESARCPVAAMGRDVPASPPSS